MRSNNQPIQVILTDDHAVVRAGIRKFLESDPRIRVVAEASNGRELIHLLPNTVCDVLVLDIQMPEMNGLTATREIRKSGSRVGILILTAYDDPPYVQALLREGANGYVLKTASPDAIIQGVVDVYEGKLVMDAQLNQAAEDLIISIADNQIALSEREIQVLELVSLGVTNKAVAANLGISIRTAQNHLANIFEKLQTESRTEAVMRAIRLGLITVPSTSNQVSTPGKRDE
jgi:DNA-binding NarL/FixJ family response regulator